MTVGLHSGTSPSRRAMLRITTGILALPVSRVWAFAKSDFWNQKESSKWSEEERNRILTNSPWAHKATTSLDRDVDGLNGGGGMPTGGMGGGSPMGSMGGGGRGGPDMGGGRGGPPMAGEGGEPPAGATPKLDVMVRWESAATIRAALADAAPAVTGAYIISVTGIPAMGAEGRGAMASDMGSPSQGQVPATPGSTPNGRGLPDFPETAQLEMKGHPPLASRSEDRRNNTKPPRILFYFEKAELPITASSNDVGFTMHLGATLLRAKFTPKEMVYMSQLCL